MKEMKVPKNLARRISPKFRLLIGLFFSLLPYQILLIVINAVNGIVDGLFASNAVGQDAMTAIGLYAPMTHFLYALSIMLLSGSQFLYGVYIGQKPERVQSAFSVDLVVSFVVSVLTSAVMVLAVATDATRVMMGDPAKRDLFNRYLIGQAIGIPGLVLGQQLFAFLSIENQTKRTTAASIVCFASNGILDALFTVVIPLGTFGLGLASSVSEWLFFGVQVIYFLSEKSNLKFSLRSCIWSDIPDIVRRGYSGALARFLEMFRCLIVNALILKAVGSVGLSAFSASNSFLGVIWALPFCMVAGERILFSFYLGEEDRESLLDTMRGIDNRRAFFSGLALEEMAGNVIEHGFTKDRRKNHSADIRVIHREDDVILRIRDDCLPFNPADRAKLLDPEDSTHNIGLRITFRIAKKVEYQNLLGCNVLTIHI